MTQMYVSESVQSARSFIPFAYTKPLGAIASGCFENLKKVERTIDEPDEKPFIASAAAGTDWPERTRRKPTRQFERF